jgi:hypothetical protein
MNTLHLEELESRHLLSSGYFMPQPSSSPQFSGGRPTTVIERPPVAGFVGDTRAFDMSGGDLAFVGMPPPAYGFGQQPVVVEMVIVIDVPGSGNRAPPVGTDAGSAGSISASAPKSVATDTGTNVVALTDAGARPTVAAARTTSPMPVLLPPAANIPPLAAEIPGPAAAQLTARTARTGDAVIVPGQALLSQFSTPAGVATPSAAGDGESADAKAAEPPLVVPALLSALPTVDLAALGRGLEQFMGRLERAGEQLVGDGEGLRPWLVAAAAAAAACEIARRQMQRTENREQRTVRAFGTVSDV